MPCLHNGQPGCSLLGVPWVLVLVLTVCLYSLQHQVESQRLAALIGFPEIPPQLPEFRRHAPVFSLIEAIDDHFAIRPDLDFLD